jgi:hypothetical protein
MEVDRVTEYISEQEAYEDLANAIIIQAVKDYRKTLSNLKKSPRCIEMIIRRNNLIRFFHSQWFNGLTKLDPETIIKKLDGEVKV